MAGLQILGLILACAVTAVPTIAVLQSIQQPSTNIYESSSHDRLLHYPYALTEAESDVTAAFNSLKQYWKIFSQIQEEQTQRQKRELENSVGGSGSDEQLHPASGDFNDTAPAENSEDSDDIRIFLPPIFDPMTFINTADSQVSRECMRGWNDLFNTTDVIGLSSGERAVDAFGNIGAGFLHENIHALGLRSGILAIDAFGKLGTELRSVIYVLGDYDECLSLSHVQYCLANLLVMNDKTLYTPRMKFALCLPQVCNDNDVSLSINSTNMKLEHLNITFSKMGNITCEIESKSPYNAGAIVMLLVWSIIATSVLGATIFQIFFKKFQKKSGKRTIKNTSNTFSRKKKILRKTLLELILSLSLHTTITSILSTKQQNYAITSLNGIRVISMFWIIMGHSLLWMLHFSNNSLYYVKHVVPTFSFQVNIGAPFAVDSFFLLSGMLVAYITLRKMDKNKGRFPVFIYYIHRILRITPAYAIVLFSYWFLTVHLADGPLWQQTLGVQSELYRNCERYWWTNMLYINNVYPWKVLDECMSWTWYLSNDMQFYVIAPVMLLPLYYIYPVGLTIIGTLIALNLAILGGITGGFNLSGNMFLITDNSDGHTVADDIYTKPWARIGPYLLGIVLGFLFYKKIKPNCRKSFNYIIYAFLWMLAFGLCFSTVYGLYGSFNGTSLGRVENISFQMFSRLSWSLGLAIVIFICHNGYGWIVNTFLSMSFWIPLSRLTFTAYLVHEIVLFVLIFTRRAPINATNITLAAHIVAAVVLSYGCAAIIASFVEFPFANVETVVFKLVGIGESETKKQAEENEHKEIELEVGVVHKNYYFQAVENDGEQCKEKWISRAEEDELGKDDDSGMVEGTEREEEEQS